MLTLCVCVCLSFSIWSSLCVYVFVFVDDAAAAAVAVLLTLLVQLQNHSDLRLLFKKLNARQINWRIIVAVSKCNSRARVQWRYRCLFWHYDFSMTSFRLTLMFCERMKKLSFVFTFTVHSFQTVNSHSFNFRPTFVLISGQTIQCFRLLYRDELWPNWDRDREKMLSVFICYMNIGDTMNTWSCAYYVTFSSVNCGIHI